MKSLSVLPGFLMLTGSANAIDAVAAFDDPEMQARYEKIISEVRCLKCHSHQ